MLFITTGKTPEKVPTVFANLFYVKIKEGLPLDLLAKKVKDHGCYIDWYAEIEAALKLGITPDNILKTLRVAYKYLYPDSYYLELEKAKWYMRLRPKVYNSDDTIKSFTK